MYKLQSNTLIETKTMNNFLYAFVFFTILNWSCKSSTQPQDKVVSTTPTSDSSEALAWLNSIFECENEEFKFCFPDEEKVLTQDFYQFLIESNQFHIDSYELNSIDKNYLENKLKNKWPNYKISKEETWPFGRGNGDVKYLEKVEIEPLGNKKYFVRIQYSDDFSTDNEVELIKTDNGFLIDFIETKYEILLNESDQQTSSNIEKFTQKWTWTYKNDAVDNLLDTYEGEMSAYYNPDTRKWLFTKESYGNSGDMVNWVIGDSNGEFVFSFQSVHPDEPYSTMNFTLEKPDYIFSLEELYKPLNNTKVFNSGSEFGEILGIEYERIYPKNTINSTRVFLGETQADMTAFYGFNQIDSETKLLYTFDLDKKNFIYLEEKTTLGHDEKKIELDFKGISKVEKIIELK